MTVNRFRDGEFEPVLTVEKGGFGVSVKKRKDGEWVEIWPVSRLDINIQSVDEISPGFEVELGAVSFERTVFELEITDARFE